MGAVFASYYSDKGMMSASGGRLRVCSALIKCGRRDKQKFSRSVELYTLLTNSGEESAKIDSLKIYTEELGLG